MPTFNNEASLRAFGKFQLLSDHIQSIILEMLKDDRLNGYGGLKRPPNAWLIFRSDMLAASPGMSSMSQAEVTVRCKARWAVATPEERMELQARARRANDDLLNYFPDYSYKPMSTVDKERWKKLGANQRKEYWLSSATRIAERIASPDQTWDGFLTLEKWAEQHASIGLSVTQDEPSAQLDSDSDHPLHMERTPEPASQLSIRHAPRSHRARNKPDNGAIGTSNSATNSPSTPSSRFHPYNKNSAARGASLEIHEREQTRTRRKATKRALLPDYLRDVLVHIGSQNCNSPRRRLVLSMFQLKDKVVWVSEEVDDCVPDEVVEQLLSSVNYDESRTDHLALREYTDPWVPEAVNEHGELFCPEIGTVAEYYEYMAAYYFAKESSSDFIWPPLPRSPSPSLSPPLPPFLPARSIAPPAQATEPALSTLQSPRLQGDPSLNVSTGASSSEKCKSFSNVICNSGPGSDSCSDPDSVTTPEDDFGWNESMPLGVIMGDFQRGELEDFEFGFQ